MYFEYLRKTVWHPTFGWIRTAEECADKINSYHEDYPKYVEATSIILKRVFTGIEISSWQLKEIHKFIFTDKSFAGRWRDVEVRVGDHNPPHSWDVAELMDRLSAVHSIRDIEALVEWYRDFETVHPFQDGNGRVGGVIVAAYSHHLHPGKGWYAPNQ